MATSVRSHAILFDSIHLVTGNAGGAFGTCFVVSVQQKSSRVVTCRHVIAQLETEGVAPKVAGVPATLLTAADSEVDLAVLEVPVELGKPLRLRSKERAGIPVVALGFQRGASTHTLRPVCGTLSGAVTLARSEASSSQPGYRAWDIKVDGDGRLEEGYSGSPVFDDRDDNVLGVVLMKQGSGGVALSIHHLEDLGATEPGLVRAPIPNVLTVIQS